MRCDWPAVSAKNGPFPSEERGRITFEQLTTATDPHVARLQFTRWIATCGGFHIVFQDSRAMGGARLWVEPAAKTRLIRQTLPKGQDAALRTDRPGTNSHRSFNEFPADRPTSSPRKTTPRHCFQETPRAGNTGSDDTRRGARLADGS